MSKQRLMLYTHPKRVNFGIIVDFMPKCFGVAIFILIWEIWLTIDNW